MSVLMGDDVEVVSNIRPMRAMCAISTKSLKDKALIDGKQKPTRKSRQVSDKQMATKKPTAYTTGGTHQANPGNSRTHFSNPDSVQPVQLQMKWALVSGYAMSVIMSRALPVFAMDSSRCTVESSGTWINRVPSDDPCQVCPVTGDTMARYHPQRRCHL